VLEAGRQLLTMIMIGVLVTVPPEVVPALWRV
jgi:hypothetical protein